MEVRCPWCHKKLAELLVGVIRIYCRQCRRIVKVDSERVASVR